MTVPTKLIRIYCRPNSIPISRVLLQVHLYLPRDFISPEEMLYIRGPESLHQRNPCPGRLGRKVAQRLFRIERSIISNPAFESAIIPPLERVEMVQIQEQGPSSTPLDDVQGGSR
jgi:hypothetical protein